MIVSEMYTQRETETRRKTKLEGRERERTKHLQKHCSGKSGLQYERIIPGVGMNSQVVETEKINHRRKVEFITARRSVASKIISCFFLTLSHNHSLLKFIAKINR